MQLIALLLTITFVFHAQEARCAPLLHIGGTRVATTRNITQRVGLLLGLPLAVMY